MPLPTDPFLASQWHLGNTGGLLDLNVRGVWNPVSGTAYTGAGIRVVVIDDGFDYLHPDLAPNYNTQLDFDFGTGTLDAFGADTEQHGTPGRRPDRRRQRRHPVPSASRSTRSWSAIASTLKRILLPGWRCSATPSRLPR